MNQKILFCSHRFSPDIGGIETISEILANAFSSAGHDVHLLTWTKQETDKQFPFKIIRNPNAIQLSKEHAWADLVFENNPCLRLSWPNLVFKNPNIVVLQTWLSDKNERLSLANWGKLWWLKKAKSVVAISSAVSKRHSPNAAIIGNSYDTEIFKILPGILKSKDFVFVGRLVSDKGCDLAIRAIKKLSADLGTRFSLTIIGDGPDRNILEDLVGQLNLQNQIHFTGILKGEPLAKCLNEHRYLLVPSIWEEPFGIVALEGMACGCLPIVSDGGGLPEAVGSAGLTFRRGSMEDLVQCIKRLVSDPDWERRLRFASKSHLDFYHPEKFSVEYLKIIDSLTTTNRKVQIKN